MAGIRHHILPKFLLKGFANKVVGQEVFTWVYRKGGKAFEANTIKVGVEKHFYGIEGELTVDDEITKVEGEFAFSLSELRLKKDSYEVSDPKAIEFIVHLGMRTKHLRDSVIDMGTFLADKLFTYFSEEGNFKAWFIRSCERNPELIKKPLLEVIQKVNISAYKKAMARQRIKRMPVKHLIPLIDVMDDEMSESAVLFQGLRIQLMETMSGMVKQAHIKSLAKGLIPEPKFESYRQLHWHIRQSDAPLILGDVGCLFELAGEDRFKSLGGKSEEIQKVYLPISTDRMLVGSQLTTAPEIDFKVINEAVAKCSRDYFVCSAPSPDMLHLAAVIGEESEMITREEMEETILQLIAEP
jgi:hypothetical protein